MIASVWLKISYICFISFSLQEAFIETAKKIYQNIQDGSLDLNAAESGVQHKPSAGAGSTPGGTTVLNESGESKESCNC